MDPEMTMLEAEEAMTKAVEYAIHEFAAVRTGKASPTLVEGLDVHVHSYGSHMKLKQLAMITTPDPRLIRIEPFDPGTLQDIDRAIRESKLGLNGSIEGKVIRLPIPVLLARAPRADGQTHQANGRGVPRAGARRAPRCAGSPEERPERRTHHRR